MVWEVLVEKSKNNDFGYLIEADTMREALEKGEKLGKVIRINLSQEMND